MRPWKARIFERADVHSHGVKLSITSKCEWMPSSVAILWALMIVGELCFSDQPIGENPVFIVVAVASLLTFGHRAGWIRRNRRKGWFVVKTPGAFSPERIVFLGFLLLVTCVLITGSTGHGDAIPKGPAVEWIVALISTVPLLEVFSVNWGELKVAKPCGNGEMIVWPYCGPEKSSSSESRSM